MPQPRTRRSPEDARLRILEAAEVRLAEGGPDAVRVQRLAADLGVTDAAIYHHFGNRAGLLDALARFGARRLRTSMEEVVAEHQGGQPDIRALVELAVDTFERRGYAQLILWLAGAGIPSDRGSGMFDAVVRAFEGSRQSVGKAGAADPQHEPRFVAALMVMVCAAEPLFGNMSRRSVGLGGGRPTTLRFRNWFAGAIAELLAADS